MTWLRNPVSLLFLPHAHSDLNSKAVGGGFAFILSTDM